MNLCKKLMVARIYLDKPYAIRTSSGYVCKVRGMKFALFSASRETPIPERSRPRRLFVMVTRVKALATAAFMGAAVVFTPVSPVAAQQNQGGLVNVAVGDISTGDILSRNNVAIGVAAQLVADVCPNLSVGNVAVLAAQANRTNVPQTATCETAAGQSAPVLISPAV
jgi:hypothetical protein